MSSSSRFLLSVAAVAAGALGCGSSGSSDNRGDSSTDGDPGASGSGGSSGGVSASSSGGTSGGSSSSSSGGPMFDAGGGACPAPNDPAPAGFWDNGNLPPAKNALMFKFLNRTNGKLQDSEIFWSFKDAALGINELHSIAQMPTYDMPANGSGRLYFYLCSQTVTNCDPADPTRTAYWDFIEFTIGAASFNGNTTRVDAFGVKNAFDLHNKDGSDEIVGEDYETFCEDRATTFQKFLNETPAEFHGCVQPTDASHSAIHEPGACGFNAGGMYATYYASFVDQLWAANGITVAKPGPNGSGLGMFPSLSGAIMRHVGAVAGSFDANGKLINPSLFKDGSTFYTAAPADYYAAFWHKHGINGKAYGFPYDDSGGWSSYVSHANPQYLLLAIGW